MIVGWMNKGRDNACTTIMSTVWMGWDGMGWPQQGEGGWDRACTVYTRARTPAGKCSYHVRVILQERNFPKFANPTITSSRRQWPLRHKYHPRSCHLLFPCPAQSNPPTPFFQHFNHKTLSSPPAQHLAAPPEPSLPINLFTAPCQCHPHPRTYRLFLQPTQPPSSIRYHVVRSQVFSSHTPQQAVALEPGNRRPRRRRRSPVRAEARQDSKPHGK